MIKFAIPGITLLFLVVFFIPDPVYAQNMLGYSDPQGDFYVNDGGKLIHLEHQMIGAVQPAANSIAYITNTGNLVYYSDHTLKKLDISNPVFFRNTDYYLYYSLGGSFSVYNGSERKFLGYIQQSPYAFGDSIAGFHDYSEYFYAYYEDRFIELEKNPAKKVIAGKNILAYVNHLDQFKIYYDNQKTDVDDYVPRKVMAGANTVAFIDSYNYLRIFYKGALYELFNLPEVNCLEIPDGTMYETLSDYCNGDVVIDVESGLPVFITGDDLVGFIDDRDVFQVFYDGKVVVLEHQAPLFYAVKDNILWYIDNNNYFKVFNEGELTVVETFYPEKILADKDIVVYTDLDKRLKCFYHGETINISENIVINFELNNKLVMYSELPNKYKFFSPPEK